MTETFWDRFYDEGQLLGTEPYCDYCEHEGHTFSQCPARDDYTGDEEV
jgi:hypothetical protein